MVDFGKMFHFYDILNPKAFPTVTRPWRCWQIDINSYNNKCELNNTMAINNASAITAGYLRCNIDNYGNIITQDVNASYVTFKHQLEVCCLEHD